MTIRTELKHPIIYLNGTSSAGKSAIATKLQPLITGSEVISADAFGEVFEKGIDMLDPRYQSIQERYNRIIDQIRMAGIQNRYELFRKFYDTLNQHPHLPEFNADLQMYRHAAAVAQRRPVIIDDLIATEFLFREALRIFAGYRVYLVRIICSVPELRKREEKRGNRLVGSAEFWQENVNFVQYYDLVINSEQREASDSAALIAEFVRDNPFPTSFVYHQRD